MENDRLRNTESVSIFTRLGPTLICLKGNPENKIWQLIKDEIQWEKTGSDASAVQPDLFMQVLDRPEFDFYVPEVYSAKENLSFNENGIFVREKDFEYLVENLFDETGTCKAYIFPGVDKLRKIVIQFLNYFINPAYSNIHLITKNSIMSYSFFWFVLALLMLRKKAAFVHSGIVSKNEKSLMLIGTGGSGKTSITFKILEEDKDFKYVAEDFGVVDSNGETFFIPKYLSIYASDTKSQQILKEYVENFSFWKKLRWNIGTKLLKRNPMIKASPFEVLGKERIAFKSKLGTAIYLIRARVDSPILEEISTEEITERSLYASFRELKRLLEIFLLLKANSVNDIYIPTFKDIEERTRAVYKCFFSKVNRLKLIIPFYWSPGETAKFILKEDLFS